MQWIPGVKEWFLAKPQSTQGEKPENEN